MPRFSAVLLLALGGLWFLSQGEPLPEFAPAPGTATARSEMAPGVLEPSLVTATTERRAMPAAVRRERDALELRVEALRLEKGELGTTEYYARLETLLLELARLYERLDADG